MTGRILTVLRKEFISVFRDPRMRLVIFGVPVIQTLIFGYAVTLDVRHVRLAVIDHDRTPASRDLVERFTASGHFDAVARPAGPEAAGALLDAGAVAAVLQLNAGFEGRLRSGAAEPVQLLVDGADSNSARHVLNHAAQVVAEADAAWLRERAEARTGRPPATGHAELRPRAWFNADLESRNYFVPGVIALLVMLVGLMLTSMAIVREKETGTIEQVLVSPLRPVEFILGKCAPFALIGLVDTALVTAVGLWWFEVPFRGSFGLLLLGTSLFLMGTLGLGLLISTVSSTQQQAMLGTFFVFFPAMLFSGFIFPLAAMPGPFQWLSLLNPLRHLLVIIRGVFLKGVGLEVLGAEFAALFALGAALLAFAVARFHKTL